MGRWLVGWGLWIGLLESLWAMPAVEVRLNPTVPVRILQVESLASPALHPPADQPPTAWRVHPLPDEWVHSHPGYSGTVWYRFAVQWPDGVPEAGWALWLPKVAMNAELWVNGRLAGRHGQMDGERVSRFWYTPLWFDLPAHVWQPGDNVVHLRVRARYPLQNGGLAPMSLGPPDLLQPAHVRHVWWQNHLTALCSMFVVSLGLFVGVLWSRQPRARQYLYFSLAAIGMGLSSSNYSVNTVPLTDAEWERLVHALLLWGPLSLALFPLGFTQLHWPRVELAVVGLGLITTGLVLVLPESQWLPVWLGVMAVGVGLDALALGRMLYHIRKEKLLRDSLLLGLAALVVLALGVHDLLLRTGWIPFERPYAHPFMVPLLLAALSWLIAGDYARSQQRLSRMNHELAERVRQREAELQVAFACQADAERERAAAAERRRILRDMHDGVGAHITTAMRQLEGGHAEPALVAQTLRDSLDQLKLSIDAMNLPPGDVNALLASLRYRLQRRIESAGLALRWEVEALPVWSAGERDAQAMRHLQYLIFEAISNTLQHAHATEMTLRASCDGRAIRIELRDDGLGPPSAGPVAFGGEGLRTMRDRARLLGAALEVVADRPGMCVRVSLPLA